MTVSLCIVAYNEEAFLGKLFNDIHLQSYPHNLTEIILVDSCSKDSTKQLMVDFQNLYKSEYWNIIICNNPRKIQASGWNVALLHTSGDIIIRVDAHTSITKNFVELNVNNIIKGEFVTGGIRPCIMEKDDLWSKMLLYVENTLFKSKIKNKKQDTQKSYVKTIFHAAYKREVFAKAGGFNENLLRTEDNELHYRIRKCGYKFCLDPQIISYQYARSNLKGMIKQKYGNGYWIGITIGVCPGCISLYHLVPLFFIISIVISSIICIYGYWHCLFLLCILYSFFCFINLLQFIKEKKFNLIILIVPILYFLLHISYGLGSLSGIIHIPFTRKRLLNCPNIDIVKNFFKKTLKLENY
jgi:glycosyltransferase involved in cell wall biosynthesis